MTTTIGRSIVLFFIAFIGIYQSTMATHVVGGELRYRHIENDQYEVILTFRRDCLNGAPNAAFDNPANVWIFNGNGNLKTNLGVNGRLKMNFNSSDTLNEIIESDCGFEGTQVCVHVTTYKETIRLPFYPGENGYLLAYQRCCRNETLENIEAPLLTGGTWVVAISEKAQLESNSSPDFNQWPPVYICANEDIQFDHSAIDNEGDSLVYSLCTPFVGATEAEPIPSSTPFPPYDEVIWKENYGIDNLLGGIPLLIDSETGMITGKPNFVGQFLVGICVEEYRDGVKIGETRRDFQYNVRICSDPPTALFEANDGNCDGPDVQFENLSLGGAQFQWNFDFPSTDSAFISTEQHPQFVYDQEGVYNVQLIVTRGADACSDTLVKQVAAIFSDIQVMYDLQIQACDEDGGYTIRLIDRSIETEVGFDIINAEWMITQNGVSQTYLGDILNLNIDPSDFIVELQVESETGCKKTLIDTVEISDFEHIADFEYALSGCSEFGIASISFEDISDGLNIYDSPVGVTWTLSSSAGDSIRTESSFVFDIINSDTLTVLLEVDFGGGCFASVVKEIIVQDLVPQASYEYEVPSCPDEGSIEIIFTNTSADTNPSTTVVSTNWEVTSAGGIYTSDSSTIQVTVPKDSVVTVQLTVLFGNGCGDILIESFVPGPFATIGIDIDSLLICLGDTLPIVSSPNSNFTYTWEPTDGLYFADTSDLSNPGVIGIVNTQYFVTVTDGLCTVDTSFKVTVLDDNNLMIDGDSITCDGSVKLVAFGGIGEGEFEWSTTSDFTQIIHVGDTLTTSFEGQSQTYYAQFTGESCDDPYAEYKVILSNIFDVIFNGDPVRVCLGDTIPLLDNPDPSLTYVWSPEGGLYFTDPNDGSTVAVIGIQDTVYNVTISDDFCSLDTFVKVIIADAQEFQILGDSIVCSNAVQLIGSGAVGIGTYVWALDPDFNNIIHEGDTLITTLSGLSQTYYVQFTDKTCGDLILSYKVRKYVFDILFAEPFKICPGDTLVYTVFNEGEGPLVFEWQEDPHVIKDGNTNMPTIGVGFGETDDFELIFTATSPTGCKYTDTVSFEIQQNPIVDFSFKLQECGEYTVCFEIEGTFNGFPSWNFGDPNVTTDISLQPAPCYTYPGPGAYEVVLANLTSFCGFEPVVKTVVINDEITIDPIADQVVCLNDSVFVTATSPDLAVSFVWCSLDGDTLQIGPLYSDLVTEDYQVIVKAEDSNGCSNTMIVNIGPFTFDIVDNVPETFCLSENTQIEMLVNGTQDGYSFQWGPEECVISGGNTANPVLLTANAKAYSVTVTYDELGCEFIKDYDIQTTSFNIDVAAEPDTVINPGDEVTLFVVDPLEEYTYEWSTGSMDTEITVSPSESTFYIVTVVDAIGCTASDTIFIRVRVPTCDEFDVFLPKAFTPNGDDINDVLFLRSNFIDEMELLIYNRWGEEMFYTNSQNVGWDGTFKGKKVAPDVYAYTLRVVCINQIEFNSRGNVSLLK